MDELEAIRARKLEELHAQAREEQQFQSEIDQLESIVKQKLTKEAVERYYNIKAANPQLAVQVLVLLSKVVPKEGAMIDDQKFKGFLERVVPKRREFKITRK
jgi:DNA-binding TFAR19-related protein (PDSD5 family)